MGKPTTILHDNNMTATLTEKEHKKDFEIKIQHNNGGFIKIEIERGILKHIFEGGINAERTTFSSRSVIFNHDNSSYGVTKEGNKVTASPSKVLPSYFIECVESGKEIEVSEAQAEGAILHEVDSLLQTLPSEVLEQLEGIQLPQHLIEGTDSARSISSICRKQNIITR